MSRIVNKALTCSLVFAISCSDSSKNFEPNTKKLPLPGMTTLPQIMFLLDRSLPKEYSWMEPVEESFLSDFPGHISFVRVDSDSSAVEQLKVLNGRDIDTLILGRGAPQRAFESEKLPEKKGRKVLAISASHRNPNWIPLEVKISEIQSWFDGFCSSRIFSGLCKVDPPNALRPWKTSSKKPPPDWFVVKLGARKFLTDDLGVLIGASVYIDWDEFFRKHLLSASQSNIGLLTVSSILIGLQSNFLKIESGDFFQRKSPEILRAFDDYKKSEALKYLESTGTKDKSKLLSPESNSKELLKAIQSGTALPDAKSNSMGSEKP